MADNGRRKQNDALALALAEGKTIRDAAAAAGVGERTASRRWANPKFRRKVAKLRGEMVGQAVGNLARGMTASATVLLLLLGSQNERVRLAAAVKVLELGVSLRQATEIEDRLAALEATAEKKR